MSKVKQITSHPSWSDPQQKKGLRCAIYARVSTEDQHCEMQLTALRDYVKRQGWDTAVEYIEKESSVKRRPVFQRMLEDCRLNRVDVVLVWRLDRFARSMKDFVNITLELKNWKVRLISATENVDSGDENPWAQFMMKLLALLAELERNIIVQRVTAGLTEYRRAYEKGEIGKARQSRSGKNLAVGRPKKIFHRDQALELRKKGLSFRRISAIMKVPLATVYDALKPAA